MGTRENECQISQKYIFHMKFSEFYMCNPILAQGFCPLKIKINQFPGGFRLKQFGNHQKLPMIGGRKRVRENPQSSAPTAAQKKKISNALKKDFLG